MRRMIAFVIVLFASVASYAHGQMVRGAFASPGVQILPMLVAEEHGF